MRLPDERIALSRGERLEMRQHGTAEFSVLNHAARQELVAEGVVIVAQHMVGKHEHRLTAAGAFLVAVHLVTVSKKYAVLAQRHFFAGGEKFLDALRDIHHLDLTVEVDVTHVVALSSHKHTLVTLAVQFVSCQHIPPPKLP